MSLWPSYLALLLSLALILMIWVNHHELFRLVRGLNHTLMFANGALLLMVTLAPFSTMVLAQHLGRPAANTAVAFYCGTFFLASVFHNLLFEAAVYQSRLLQPGTSQSLIIHLRRSYRFGMAVYALAAIVAIWSAIGGLIISTCLRLLWTRLHRRRCEAEK